MRTIKILLICLSAICAVNISAQVILVPEQKIDWLDLQQNRTNFSVVGDLSPSLVFLSNSALPCFAFRTTSPKGEKYNQANLAEVKTADSLSRWTRNIVTYPTFSTPGNAVNYTDPNGVKQGKWVTIVAGKIVFTVEYKDGKVVEGC